MRGEESDELERHLRAPRRLSRKREVSAAIGLRYDRRFMTAAIRIATEDDAARILAIYAPIVTGTAISFELDSPSLEEMRRRIGETLPDWPWLVCERDGDLLGYAYADRHRTRAAYQWAADVSVYVAETARRAGIGRALYRPLLRILDLQGYFLACAGIALPNPASVALHESVGFEPVGIYRSVGWKLGAWHDVGWWQLSIRERSPDPALPLAFQAVRDSAEVSAALAVAPPRHLP